jgi:hypothetical protein
MMKGGIYGFVNSMPAASGGKLQRGPRKTAMVILIKNSVIIIMMILVAKR